MKFLRILLTAFCFTTFGLGGLFIGSFIFPLILIFGDGRKQRFIFSNIIHISWKLFVYLMSACRLISVKMVNSEHLKSLKGKIVVANHPSLIDIVILISQIPNSICIVKGSLANNFFIKNIIKCVYILNNEDFEALSHKVDKALKENFNIIIFPEGTRTNFNNKEYKLHRGFAQLAIKSNAGIIPINIESTPHILGKNQKWYDIGVSVVKYTITSHNEITICKNDKISNHTQAKELVNCVKAKIFNAFSNN